MSTTAAPTTRYEVTDGGGGAVCHGCRSHLVHSWRAIDTHTGRAVNVCSTCAALPR